MSEDEVQEAVAPTPVIASCAECETKIEPGMDHEVTDSGTFCRSCYSNLVAQVQQAVTAQSENINYPMALVGALGGAAIGVLVWWGFTVLTEIAFGLVAIVIGLGVAKGAVILSGDKRSTGLQAMAILVSIVAFLYASYLVNRTFIHRAFVEEGLDGQLPLLPDLSTFIEVIGMGFSPIDLIFLGIVVYEAWKIPAPIQLGSAA